MRGYLILSLTGGGWQSSGGSRVFTDEELDKALTEAGMI